MAMTRKNLTISIIAAVIIIGALSFSFLPTFQFQRETISNYFKIIKQKNEQENLFQKAQSFYQKNQYQEALEKYQELLDKYPGSPRADDVLLAIGRCQQQLGNYDQALSTFQKLMDDYPSSPNIPDAFYYSAICYFRQGELEKTEEYCNKILKEYPGSEEGIINATNSLLKSEIPAGKLLRGAQSLFNEGGYQKALEKYQELLDKYPGSSLADDALMMVGYHQKNNLGNYDQALSTFQKLMNDYPDSVYIPDALLCSAEIYARQGELEKAEEYCNKILNEYPEAREEIINSTKKLKSEISAEKLFLEAQSLFNEGGYQKALEKYQELLDKYPEAKEETINKTKELIKIIKNK